MVFSHPKTLPDEIKNKKALLELHAHSDLSAKEVYKLVNALMKNDCNQIIITEKISSNVAKLLIKNDKNQVDVSIEFIKKLLSSGVKIPSFFISKLIPYIDKHLKNKKFIALLKAVVFKNRHFKGEELITPIMEITETLDAMMQDDNEAIRD